MAAKDCVSPILARDRRMTALLSPRWGWGPISAPSQAFARLATRCHPSPGLILARQTLFFFALSRFRDSSWIEVRKHAPAKARKLENAKIEGARNQTGR